MPFRVYPTHEVAQIKGYRAIITKGYKASIYKDSYFIAQRQAVSKRQLLLTVKKFVSSEVKQLEFSYTKTDS